VKIKNPRRIMAMVGGEVKMDRVEYDHMAKVTAHSEEAVGDLLRRCGWFPNFMTQIIIREMHGNGVTPGVSCMDDYFKYDSTDDTGGQVSCSRVESSVDGWSPAFFEKPEYQQWNLR
jgi:hypothetical protein